MSEIVRASPYVDMPTRLVGRIKLFRCTPEVSYEEARYEVILLDAVMRGTTDAPGVTIGYVTKHRTESWRKAGRIRTSLIGRPVHWEARRTPGWRPVDQDRYDRSVGYHHTRRNAAAVALAEAYLEWRDTHG